MWFVANDLSLQGLAAFPGVNPINSSRWPFCSSGWALVIGLLLLNLIMTSNVSHKLAKSRLQPVAVRHLRRKRLDLILFIVICRLYSYFNVAAVLSNTLCCLSTSKCGLTLMIADSNNSDILSTMLLNSLKQLTHTRAQWHPVLQIFYLLFKLKEKKNN